jgi:hypothetical protein
MHYPNIQQKVSRNFSENYLFLSEDIYGIHAYNFQKHSKELITSLENFKLLCTHPENVEEMCSRYISTEQDLETVLEVL